MFSPDPSRAQSLRPKRNRQTTGTDDTIKLPQAKRKRSALRRDTFEPLTEASLNEVAGREITEDKSNGHATPPIQPREITIRGKKPEKRSERAAGSATMTLANNDFYTVVQLPTLPEQIRNHPDIPYSCVISPEYGYALALTHTDALIWPFNSSASTPSSRDVINFKLPFPPSSVEDPLPLATFTAKSASGEPGLLVVSSRWGKVVYWETISSASSFLPGQTSSGVQGSVPGLMSGEVVEELVNAEPSGFMLAFKHGRVAHLTIRDQMGRPGIGVQFLRKYTNTSGIFGSIRNAFSGDRRRGTPIIKAGASRKGQRDVVIATEDAELEFWNTNLSVGNSIETSFSFKEAVLDALKSTVSETSLHFKILDVELSAGPSTALSRRDSHGAPMMVLAALSTDTETNYHIIEMVVDEGAKVKVVHPIKCYTTPLTEQHSWRPRLCLSKSQPMVFVLFEAAVVLFSLAKITESPSSQLLMERHALPDPFQDCIRFQEGAIFKVLGHALEMSDKQSSIVFGVQGFGIVKVMSHLREQQELDVEADDLQNRITAKTKIEQAIFFGTIKQNPLDLKSTTLSFSSEEVQSAALEISSEILSSSSKHLPRTAPQIDTQMRLRAKALNDLAQHLIEHYPAQVSRVVRFQLLLNAEKLAAAQAIWKVQEEIQRNYPQDDREMSYLDFTLRALHESRQKYPNPEKGENDRVRHWLANSPGQVNHLLSELVSCLRELKPMDVTNPAVVADYLKEAVELWIAAYAATFKFREDNAPHYGLGDEVFEDGVLKAGFPIDMPHPWSSGHEPFGFGQTLIYDVCTFLQEWWQVDPNNKKKKMPTDIDGKPHEAPKKPALKELAARLPTEVELFSRLVKEESIQTESRLKKTQKDPEVLRDEIRNLEIETRQRLRQALLLIAKFNMLGAIHLAEKLQDFGLLMELTYVYSKALHEEALQNPALVEINDRKLGELQAHAETYFDRFGKGWAFANFSRLIIDGGLGTLLQCQEDENKRKYIQWFFNKAQECGQQLGKLSWMTDVIISDDYSRAEKTLAQVSTEETVDIWSKKTELALAKLAHLAAGGEDLEKYNKDIALIEIQELVHLHVTAAIGPTVDDKAANDLAAEIFASRVIAKMPALKRQLKNGLKSLLSRSPLSPEELVDVLTLMDPTAWMGDDQDDPKIVGNEFNLALRVVGISTALSTTLRDDLRAIIWRRAMIRDDWLTLNDTAGKNDTEVGREMTSTSLFKTLQAAFIAEQTDGGEVPLLSPGEILTREVLSGAIQHRFVENELEGIRKDLNKEQARLKSFVDKARLEDHYGGLVASAERGAREYADRQGEMMAKEASTNDNDA